jgi:Glycosyl transferase family 2
MMRVCCVLAKWGCDFAFRQDEPMTRRSPRISIGLPVYNGEKFLPEVIENFLSQTFADIEIVIGDNASTDSTPQICRAYAARDTRVRYFRNEKNLGAIVNFNRVFELAQAPLFKWAAHEDLYLGTYLGSCVRIVENPDVLAHSGTALIDEKWCHLSIRPHPTSFMDPRTGAGQPGHRRQLSCFGALLAGAVERPVGSHMFGVMRREALAQTQLLPNFAGGDRAMLAELALLGRFQSTREALYLKRFHEQVS